MIAELYSYGMQHGITSNKGVISKKIDAEVHIFSNGNVSVTVLKSKDPKRERLCLDSGSAAQGGNSCNFPSEKAGIIFPDLFRHENKESEIVNKQGKTAFYFRTLKELSAALPKYRLFCEALAKKEIRDAITSMLIEKQVKSDKKIAFIYDGEEIDKPSDPALRDWWNAYCTRNTKDDAKKATKGMIICGASGAMAPPAEKTFGKVHTLGQCGGHASGDTLMSYDKAAFESYGLKGNVNSGMSENAIEIVNATFEMLSKSAPVLAGKKWVCWYSDDIPFDIIENLEVPSEDEYLDNLFQTEDILDDTSDETIPDDLFASESDAHAVEKKTKDMLLSVKKGNGFLSSDTRYYLACVSGASGRVRYHSWYTGQYTDLYHNLIKWWEDLYFPNICERKPKLVSLERAMFRPQRNGETDYNDSMRKVNGNKGKELIEAALFNRPIPYSVALSTYQNIRQIIIGSKSNENDMKWERNVPCECFALLKAYFVRKKMEGDKNMTKTINTDCQAYHWGRAFAIYERAKNIATDYKPGVGVAEKYFDSASRTPFKVGRSLESEFHHHLDKIGEKSIPKKIYLEQTLSEIYAAIGDGKDLTRPLSQEEQFLFTLGFRQQVAEMNKKKTNNTEEGEK